MYRRTRMMAAAGCAAVMTTAGLALAADGTDPSGDAGSGMEDIVSYSVTRADPSHFAAAVTFAEAAGEGDSNTISVKYGKASGSTCTEPFTLSARRGGGSNGAGLSHRGSDGKSHLFFGSSELSGDGKTVTISGEVPTDGSGGLDDREALEDKTNCAVIKMSGEFLAAPADTTAVIALPEVGQATPTPEPEGTTTPVPTATPDPIEPGSKCEKSKRAKAKAAKKLNKLKKNDRSRKAIKKAKSKLAAAKKAVKKNC